MVRLRGVSYSYPLTSTPSLKAIDLDVEEGEVVAVVGPSGAGKSTLCHVIAGFVPHFHGGTLDGEVIVDGLDTVAADLHHVTTLVGLVFENPFTQMSGSKYTVRDELAFGLENLGVDRAEMLSRIEAVAVDTGIDHLLDRSPYVLSGGEQQRVALASILVMRPKVLVLDEPTSQLDPAGTREVFDIISRVAEGGMTVVIVEHKMEWVAQVADRIVALVGGSVHAIGPPHEVLVDDELAESGMSVSRYTSTARAARRLELWPEDLRLPLTLAESRAGFEKVL